MTSEKKTNGLLLFGFEPETYKAFCRAGHRPVVWVKTGRKAIVATDNGTTIYNHTPLKLSQVDAVLSMDLDRDLAIRVHTESYPFYLRNINRQERCRSVAGTSWADKVNRLEIMINWYHHMIVKHDIRTLVFNNVPHGGSTIALYFLAQAMGLQVLLCYRSIFTGGFFCIVDDFRDIGLYRSGVTGPVQDEIQPEDRPAKPFYVTIKPRSHLYWQMINLVAAIGKNLVTRKFGKDDRIPFRRRELCALRDRLVFMKMEKAVTTTFDPERKYVYFPLHFQPELASDVLGGIYSDQILAIEELRRALPGDVHIYVKENPSQSLYCREPSFFKRLGAVPGTTYLPSKINTFELIEHSWAVAAIMGTAGWEALQMGRPVICFGYAWYRCLPGVFAWPDEYNSKTVENFQFDREKLREGVGEMSRHFHRGLSAVKKFSTQVEDFDLAINGDRVAQAVIKCIQTKGKSADTGA